MLPFAMNAPRRFPRDEAGSTATLFAIALVPTVLAVGMAVDYSHAARDRAELAAAVDATSLMLAHEATTLNAAQLTARGQQYFTAIYRPRNGSPAPTITVKSTKTGVSVTAAGSVSTNFMPLGGVNAVPIKAASSVAFGVQKIEVALVLDNTGSMSNAGKMAALKVAATNFVNQIAAKSHAPGDVKIAIVPFSTTVRADNAKASAPWLQLSGVTSATWDGCIADRAKPWDVTATPGASYPGVACPYYEANLSRMIGLTDVSIAARRATLINRIASLTPTGNTNITIGLTWGQSAITAGSQLPGAAPASPSVRKFVVLLTDGDNTQNGFNDPYVTINARTSAACDEVKASGATLYTIRVIAGNAALLQACASSTDKYFEAQDAGGIQPAFDAILNSILNIRITA